MRRHWENNQVGNAEEEREQQLISEFEAESALSKYFASMRPNT